VAESAVNAVQLSLFAVNTLEAMIPADAGIPVVSAIKKIPVMKRTSPFCDASKAISSVKGVNILNV
jgi:hypothetical protein